MKPLDMAAVLSGAEPIDDLLREPSVLVQYRPHFLKDDGDRCFLVPPGGTIAEIVHGLVAEGHIPFEAAALGSVFLSDGGVVRGEFWCRVRPKADHVIFLAIVPEGGDNLFAQIAGIAIAVFAIAISGGALATLAPAIFGTVAGVAGPLAALGTGIGAQLAGLAVGVGGGMLVNAVSKPPQLGGGGGGSQPLGVAGIGGNPLGNTQPVPVVRGRIRLSPPTLAAPFTQIVASSQVANAIFGVRAPVAISGTMIDGIDIADIDQVEIEHRDGFTNSSPLTLVTTSWFEETVNVQLRKQELKDDSETLFSNDAESYPLPYTMKSKRNGQRFRVILHFPAGFRDNQNGDDHRAIIPVRIRMKKDGGSWINLPELILQSDVLTPLRRELLFEWSTGSGGKASQSGMVLATYASNPDWTADAYFNGGSPPTGVDTSVTNMDVNADSVVFFLDPEVFEVGPAYTFEITRGYALATAAFNPSTYNLSSGSAAKFFTYQTTSSGDLIIPKQDRFSAEAYVESFATGRDVYPIVQDGLALTALRARNRKVNSLSQIYESIVPTFDGSDWDTVAASRNNAALALDLLRNPDNYVFAQPDRKFDWTSWEAYYQHCASAGLTYDGIISDSTIDDAVRQILAAGDAEPRRDGQVIGVVIDKDRSAEGMATLITPAVMVRPLTLEKSFDPYTTAVTATFADAANDYASKEIFVDDDGFMLGGRHLIEAIDVPGITTEAMAIRWCKIYLRRLRYRRLKYMFGVDLDHLLFKRGDLIGVAHDMLTNSYGTGRVVSFAESGGNLVSLTLDNDVLDGPPSSYESFFDVEDVFALGDVFTLTSGPVGARLRLRDGLTTVVPIASISGKTLTVAGAFALPNGLEATCPVAVGPRGREVHRVVVGDIAREGDRQALVTGFREVSKSIFAGL